ncbi:MAG: hypothetical protein ACK5E3_14290, partial [Planctomycetota bacterium]
MKTRLYRFLTLIVMSVLPLAFEQSAMAQQSSDQKTSQVFWVGGYGPGIYASRLNADGSMAKP